MDFILLFRVVLLLHFQSFLYGEVSLHLDILFFLKSTPIMLLFLIPIIGTAYNNMSWIALTNITLSGHPQ